MLPTGATLLYHSALASAGADCVRSSSAKQWQWFRCIMLPLVKTTGCEWQLQMEASRRGCQGHWTS